MGRVPARCILLLEDLDAAFTRSVTRDANSTGLPTNAKKDASTDANAPTVQNNPNNANNNKDGNNENQDVNTLSLSGLLNSLDGVAAAEGRILFATTNHLERLDPALSRPGRMDVWVEFKNASKWQCEQLFRNFFPSSEDVFATSSSAGPSSISEEDLELPNVSYEPLDSSGSSSSGSSASGKVGSAKGKEKETVAPAFPPPSPSKKKKNAPLDPGTLAKLAKEFAEAIPEGEFSVAALQGCEYPSHRYGVI